jgi:hypothetical protein
MTRSEALLKLLALEPETRARLIVITGWDADGRKAVLDTLVAEGKVTYRNGTKEQHGERLYYPKRVPQAMLAHCLWLLERAGSQYAMWAADWYEANDPDWLDGLGQRLRKEVADRLVG